MRIYGAYTYFSGNDETEFSKKLNFFAKPPIRRESHTALPTYFHDGARSGFA